MNNCETCAGEGLVGSGAFPILRQGSVTTCNNCEGTGKVIPAEPTEEPLNIVDDTVEVPEKSDADVDTEREDDESADVQSEIEDDKE